MNGTHEMTVRIVGEEEAVHTQGPDALFSLVGEAELVESFSLGLKGQNRCHLKARNAAAQWFMDDFKKGRSIAHQERLNGAILNRVMQLTQGTLNITMT